MTETKATPNKEANAVTVKLSKLTEGIGMVFAGVLTMLEALDASSANQLLERLNASGKKQDDQEEKHDMVGGAGTEQDADKAETDKTVTEAAPAESTEEAATVSPGVTQDDITKIIVQKLKKDRTNNEKIGAILKTYGAAKVSELPAEKYEAFLTDLSQL